LNEYGAMDLTREVAQQFQFENTKFRIPEDHIENYDGDDYDHNIKRITKKTLSGINRDSKRRMQERENEYPYSSGNEDIKIEGMDEDERQYTLETLSIRDKQLKTTSSEDRRKRNMKPAVIEISKVDANGAIEEITIVDRGSGYDPDPDNPPKIFVVDVEEEEYKMKGPNTKKAQKAFKDTVAPPSKEESISGGDRDPVTGRIRDAKVTSKSLKEIVGEKSKLRSDQLSVLDDGTIGSLQTMMNGFNAKYPTGYIKIGEVDPVEKTQLCQGIPKTCVKITAPKLVSAALPTASDLENLITNSTAFAEMYQTSYSEAQQAAAVADGEHDKLSDFYGWNNGQECIVIPQPKFYNVTRFKDLPCPYIDPDSGRAFGWIVYKYCASKIDNGSFKVTMSVRGRTTGPDGENFMEFMHSLEQPALTQPREVVVGDKKNCWKCTRNLASISFPAGNATGAVEGRCYWDPSGGDDVIFVPIGLDENTYDWDHGNFSELSQLSVWLGQNIKTYRRRSLTYSSTYYTASVERLSGGMPAHECWDTYVYRSSGNGNPNGVLDVYGAYYPLGSGDNQTQGKTPGQTFWESRGDGSQGVYQGFGTLVGGIFANPCTFPVLYNYTWAAGSNALDALWAGIFGGSSATAGVQNEFALEYVNDLSIAIDPYKMNQLGMIIGPTSGIMTVKNWSAGSTITFGQTARNMGNPYFDECSGGVFDARDEVVQPNPPVSRRKVHTSSYDPSDKQLLKKQYSSVRDIEFEDDTWKDFVDEDFDYKSDINDQISDFSTDTKNLFNG